MYSWFRNYVQNCVNYNNCQQRLVNIYRITKSWITDITTIGAREIVTPAISESINFIRYAKDYLQGTAYPSWAAIATYGNYEDIEVGTLDAPVREGWVAFGDSYAAGIGAGMRLDTDATCNRGTGSYIAILNQNPRSIGSLLPVVAKQPSSSSMARRRANSSKPGSPSPLTWPPAPSPGTTSDSATS
jgi:hypothetical protein